MFTKAILPDTFRALQLVSAVPSIQKAYLAGGTALALQIGHRVSEDLDFFTREEIDEKIITADLSRLASFQEDGQSWRSVWGKLGKTRFSIFYYKYPLISNTIEFEGVHVLDKPDIAAMKIHAIEDRGTKRDFVDMYFLLKDYRLEEILSFYEQKYGALENHYYSIVRSLDYFQDADHDERNLEMLVDVKWELIKKFFHNESMRLAKSHPDLF